MTFRIFDSIFWKFQVLDCHDSTIIFVTFVQIQLLIFSKFSYFIFMHLFVAFTYSIQLMFIRLDYCQNRGPIDWFRIWKKNFKIMIPNSCVLTTPHTPYFGKMQWSPYGGQGGLRFLFQKLKFTAWFIPVKLCFGFFHQTRLLHKKIYDFTVPICWIFKLHFVRIS